MTLLEINNIRHCFDGLIALNKVSFQVPKGHIKAVIGPNGAGKSTLFNLISGIFRPTMGTILFNAKPITGLQPYQIARLGISRTFQNPSLFLRMSVLENVMVGRHCRTHCGFVASSLRLPSQRKEEKALAESARAQLQRLGIESKADVPVGSLSFGQRRMVELARALATEPQLLLLDEPASGLNTRETEELATLICRIRDSGVTILLVEHDMSLVMDISEDILVLHYGTPIAEGSPTAVRNNPNVIAVYLGGGADRAPNNEPSMRIW